MNGKCIIDCVEAVTKKWTKQRKQEERGQSRARREALTSYRGPSIKEVAWLVMEKAYMKTSGDGKLPASARQIYYAARREIMEATGKSSIDSAYFTQAILPEYQAAHPKETAGWDVVYDARGHFTEPHTEVITPLGTLDVRNYLAEIGHHAVDPLDAGDFLGKRLERYFPTRGPRNRFGAVLFIEKEGFMPLFEATKLAERYDIAIMSTKGMPVVACRHLADVLCGKYRIPLMVLHDFDKAGFSIFGTLDGRNADPLDGVTRYEYRNSFRVIDLGLRLEDVQAYQLESEPVRYRSNPSWNLRSNGATDDEIKFLCGGNGGGYWSQTVGKRVELNAFTSGDFIHWVENKLTEHGIAKVIPDAETLETAYRRALHVKLVEDRLDTIVYEAAGEVKQATLPKNLDRAVRKGLKADPARSWDEVVADIAGRSL